MRRLRSRLRSAAREHEPARHDTCPTIGHLLVWRSLYEVDDHLYSDRIRVSWFGAAQRTPGTNVAGVDVADLSTQLREHPRVVEDFRRFRWFAGGWVARAPDAPDVIGDVRYSLRTESFDPDATPPTEWVDRTTDRELRLGKLWNEITGRDPAYRSLPRPYVGCAWSLVECCLVPTVRLAGGQRLYKRAVGAAGKERGEDHVGVRQSTIAHPDIIAVAGIPPVCRFVDQAGGYRVEVDVAGEVQQVRFLGDKLVLVGTLEEWADAIVALVDGFGVGDREAPESFGNALGSGIAGQNFRFLAETGSLFRVTYNYIENHAQCPATCGPTTRCGAFIADTVPVCDAVDETSEVCGTSTTRGKSDIIGQYGAVDIDPKTSEVFAAGTSPHCVHIHAGTSAIINL